MSRLLRGSSSIKEGSKVTSYSKDRLPDEQQDHALKSYKNISNRYHFGMTGQQNDEVSKNGRDYKEHGNVNADLLYKKSKEHFGAWDIKDIVQNESLRSRKQTDRFEGSRLTNGRSKNDSTRQDRCDDHEETLQRDDGTRTGSIDREHAASHRSKKKESWENSDVSKATSKLARSKYDDKDDAQRNDERDQLLKEIENLAVDGRSPDRRIKAMIERFKSREEDKLKFRAERDSHSPEKDEYRSKSGGRGEVQEDRINDREGERRSGRSKLRDLDTYEQEDNRNRSVDRRIEKSNDSFTERKADAYGVEKAHRRSREMEDDVSRRKNSPKRRSYVYDGNPEDFDVRIQKYERALVEPRRDLESPRRVSLKDSDVDLGRKDSFKDHDRQVTRKSSFKSADTKKSHSRDREPSLSRKTSFKDEENDLYRKNSFKSQDVEKKYFGREPEHVSRKNSLKEQVYDARRKNSFKEQNSDYGRILPRNRDDEEERKRSLKGHTDGVSRITFKEHDFDSGRIHSYKDQEPDVGRVSFKDHSSGDLGRKNSFKEKTVEFGRISYKDRNDDADRRPVHKGQDNEPSKVSFRNLDEPRRRHSPNGRYVEFGSVSFQTQDDETRTSPLNDQDYDLERDSSLKRRTSSRSKNHEAVDKRSNRHSRPLTPPKRDEPKAECRKDAKDREEFDSKSWHESNRIFAAKYFRENSRYRANPEGRSEIDRDPSPETGIQEFHGRKQSNEGFGNEIEDSKRSCTKLETYSGFGNGEHPRDLQSRYTSTHERNGATIIRIRTSPETSPAERRRRRRPIQDTYAERRRRYEAEDEADSDEDEEENDRRQRGSTRGDGSIPGRGVSTPSRRVWNYREGVWHFHESIAFDQSFMVQKREAIFINRWRR